MGKTTFFDQLVGKVAGAIYLGISQKYPHPPLLLVPAITYKVRKELETIINESEIPAGRIIELAHAIRISLIPVLFSYDVDGAIVEQVAPLIESCALEALRRAA